MSRKLTAVFAASLTALATTALPVLAADDGGTSATIVLSATGALSISAPDDTTPVNLATVDYGTGSGGSVTWPTSPAANVATLVSDLGTLVASEASGQLGTVTVTDARVGLVVSWTSSVAWSDFKLTAGATDASEIIEAANIRYTSGPATTTGVGTFVPSLLPVATGGQAITYTGVLQTSGSNSVAWNPTFYIDLNGEVVGTYSGTITHSVTAS